MKLTHQQARAYVNADRRDAEAMKDLAIYTSFAKDTGPYPAVTLLKARIRNEISQRMSVCVLFNQRVNGHGYVEPRDDEVWKCVATDPHGDREVRIVETIYGPYQARRSDGNPFTLGLRPADGKPMTAGAPEFAQILIEPK